MRYYVPSLNTSFTILESYVAFQVSSAIVQSLPNPSVFGGVWYAAFYNFVNILIGDFKSFLAQKGVLPK